MGDKKQFSANFSNAAPLKKLSKRKEIENDYIDHELIFYDEFDDAIVGVVERFGGNFSVLYSKDKVFEILMSEGLEFTDALEHFEYNIIGGYLGDATPVFLDDLDNY